MPPLFALSLVFEGPTAIELAIRNATVGGWLAVTWQAAGNTLFGFAAWSWLLSKHDAATVTPYALLIPVFGMGASAAILGESMPPWKLIAGAMVLGGIAIITLAPLLRSRR